MKLAAALLSLALAAALAFLASPAHAQPELTGTTPEDGERLDAVPDIVELCFSEPIAPPLAFKITLPDGSNPGVSIDFAEGNACVRVLPLFPEEPLDGDYALDWQVAAAGEDAESASGRLDFSVETAKDEEPSDGDTPIEDGGEPADGAGESPGSEAAGGGVEDILLKALLTTGVAWGIALVVTVLHLVRKRIGFEPHAPPPAEESGEHH